MMAKGVWIEGTVILRCVLLADSECAVEKERVCMWQSACLRGRKKRERKKERERV